MQHPIRRHLLALLALLVLLAVEFGVAFGSILHAAPCLLLVLAGLMVAVVSLAFMELGRESTISHMFVVGGLLGLMILLGLGTLDPFTRASNYVPSYSVSAPSP